MERSRPEPWFTAKRIGYGAGLPANWQGWVATVVFFVLLGLDLRVLDGAPQWIGALLLVACFVLLVRARTEGGWRWRSGRK